MGRLWLVLVDELIVDVDFAGLFAILARALVNGDEFDQLHTHLSRQLGNADIAFQATDKLIYIRVTLDLAIEAALDLGEFSGEIFLFFLILWQKIDADFLKTDKAAECIAAFDRVMPDYKHISSIKKIDSILWSIRWTDWP